MGLPKDRIPDPHKDLPASVSDAYLSLRDELRGETRVGLSEEAAEILRGLMNGQPEGLSDQDIVELRALLGSSKRPPDSAFRGPVVKSRRVGEFIDKHVLCSWYTSGVFLDERQAANLSCLVGASAVGDWTKMERVIGQEGVPKVLFALWSADLDWEKWRKTSDGQTRTTQARKLAGKIESAAENLRKCLDDFRKVDLGIGSRHPGKSPDSPWLREELDALIERCTRFCAAGELSPDPVVNAALASRQGGGGFERALAQALSDQGISLPGPDGFVGALVDLAAMLDGVDVSRSTLDRAIAGLKDGDK